MPITFEIVRVEYVENKNLTDYFWNSNNEYAENKVLPITFELVTDEYVENKNLIDYF